MTLLIDNDDVARLLSVSECMDVLEETYRELGRGEAANRHRVSYWTPWRAGTSHSFATMDGVSLGAGVAAVRIRSDVHPESGRSGASGGKDKYASSPGNYCGLVFLFSIDNGEPIAIINDGLIQHLRVAATSGVAAKYLARPDSRVLGMIGSGGQARSHAQAFAALGLVQEIRVYSPNPQHREAFAREMRETLDVEATAFDNPREAVQGADIVAACTDSTQPVVAAEWLRKGTHVTSVRHHSEMGADILRQVDVLVTHQKGEDPNYRLGRPEEQSFGQRQPTPVPQDTPILPDLVLGLAPGRSRPDQTTYFLNNVGEGTQFAACGALAYRKARAQGLGRQLPTEWFLQDIRD